MTLSVLLAALLAVPGLARPLVVCDDVRDPLTLDPHREFSEKNHTIVQQIFEGLVRFGPDGQIEPALATEWRRLDPLTLQFKLRPGVVFHDGQPMTAADVKFSVDRYLNPATGFPALGYLTSLERVDVLDDLTVNVVTRYPDSLLLNRLAGFVVVVPKRHYESHDAVTLSSNPVGTGPFRFEEWVRGKELRLSVQPGYWRQGYPKVDGLTFRFIPNERQVDALLSGEVDLLTTLPGTRTLEVQRSTTAFVVKKPTFYTIASNFNTSREPLSDKRVRKAINLGIDRKALVRYDIFGNGVPVATLSLPGEDGHNAKLRPYPYDPEAARRLLAAAGRSKGVDLQVLLKVNAERTGHIIQKQLEPLGIRLHFTPVLDSQLFELLRDRARWDMAIYDCPDPMHHAFFIRSIFLAADSPFSLSPVPGVDARFEALVAAPDHAAQQAASEDLDRYIHEEHLAMPTYQRLRTYGLRRGVTFIPYRSGMPYFFAAEMKEGR